MLGVSLVLFLATAIGAAAIEFTPELYSLGWHGLHHGVAHFESKERTAYEIKIPAAFSAFRPDECSVSVSKQSGPIRHSLGRRASSKMSFSACRIYTTANEIEANAPKLRDELGIQTIQREKITVAGQELKCYERFGNQEMVQGAPVSAVDCVPLSSNGELSASFVGSGDHLPAFYSLLRTVKRPDID
jgi:hypothetical protein